MQSAPCPVPPSFGAGRRITRAKRSYASKRRPAQESARALVNVSARPPRPAGSHGDRIKGDSGRYRSRDGSILEQTGMDTDGSSNTRRFGIPTQKTTGEVSTAKRRHHQLDKAMRAVFFLAIIPAPVLHRFLVFTLVT